MRRAAVTGLVALVLLCGVLLFVPRLREARLTLGAVLARFGVLVGMESEDVTFRSADVSLSGTIVFPEQSQPTASVVLVHGSGRVPRMLWLARLFASEGLAVLTYDKRGVGKSGGQFQGGPSAAGASNLDLLAQDAAAAANVLVQHPRTGEAPVGYIGVSQGGWIVPIAASRPPAVSFMLFFSGPVATVSEERHFSNLAENDRRFWQTHSRADVAEYMKSVRYSDGDVDPRAQLATLQVPGFWAFGGQDNIMPVDVSVTLSGNSSRAASRSFSTGNIRATDMSSWSSISRPSAYLRRSRTASNGSATFERQARARRPPFPRSLGGPQLALCCERRRLR